VLRAPPLEGRLERVVLVPPLEWRLGGVWVACVKTTHVKATHVKTTDVKTTGALRPSIVSLHMNPAHYTTQALIIFECIVRAFGQDHCHPYW
jgi:hypothetical protein